MNIKKYINMMLLKLSQGYKINLTEIKTYKEGKKYTTIKLTIYKYGKDKKNKSIEVNSDRELILKLKEMI